MRSRRLVAIPALLLVAVLVACASCRSVIRVVDENGSPVRGAAVSTLWLSVSGAESLTDADGRARLDDGWSLRGAPRWIAIRAQDRSRHFDYPPPPVVRLAPAVSPLRSNGSQPPAAAGGDTDR